MRKNITNAIIEFCFKKKSNNFDIYESRKNINILRDILRKRLQATAERQPFVEFSPKNCPIQQKQHIILMRFLKYGDPKRYFVLLGKRSMQAKE